MTDETTPPGSHDPARDDPADEGVRDLGAVVAAVGGTVSGIARDIADKAGPTVKSAAEKASPAVREATAKAAEVAAKAADAAGPIAHKVADVTSDVGAKLAERSREFAADVRRASEGAVDAVDDAVGDVAGKFRRSGDGGDADRAVHDAAETVADAGDALGESATRTADDLTGRPSV
ncbi:MAG: hypothetical protein M3P84_00580 [Chloroflexota bacterium]|nr:hypothetical protein [Chloroflexota bacterium]